MAQRKRRTTKRKAATPSSPFDFATLKRKRRTTKRKAATPSSPFDFATLKPWLFALAGLVLGALVVLGVPYMPSIKPGPKPPKPAAGAWVIVVDAASPTTAAAKVIDGPTLRALKVEGKCRVYDERAPAVVAKNYAPLVKAAGGAPALLVLSKDGHDVLATKLPSDDAALVAALKPHIPINVKLRALPSLPSVYRFGTSPVQRDPASGLDFVTDPTTGEKRMLGSLPSRGKFKLLPRYADHNPVFPESHWYEVDRRDIFGSEDWIYDQDGHGSCVGNGWVGALRRARVIAGMKDVNLSPAFLYSLINGNSDHGAIISDGIQALSKVGTCSFQLVGQNPIYQRQMPAGAKAEAARFKLGDAYRCDTWDETVSALLTGRFLPVYGYQVGNHFEHADQYGVAGHDSGPGNHCNHADGLRKLPDGRWVLDDVNSWNYRWGPFKNGRVYLDKRHLFGGGDQPDVCVIRIPADDPQEPHDPPAYKP
jgi:hypothetical protein